MVTMIYVLAVCVIFFTTYWWSRRDSIVDRRDWFLHEGLLVAFLSLVVLVLFWFFLGKLS